MPEMINPRLPKENFTRERFSDHSHPWLLLQAKIKRESRLKSKIEENVISFKILFRVFPRDNFKRMIPRVSALCSSSGL